MSRAPAACETAIARCRRIAGAGRRQGPPRSTARRVRPSSTGCLPHSATRSSGAISFARSRSLKACGVPSSSTTHLTAMLASITSVFTARRAPRGAGSPTASASGALSARANLRRACRRKAHARRQVPGEGFPDARPRAVPGGSPLQFGDQPIVQVAHVQASSHQLLYESIANNDLISRAAGSRNDITRSRLGACLQQACGGRPQARRIHAKEGRPPVRNALETGSKRRRLRSPENPPL